MISYLPARYTKYLGLKPKRDDVQRLLDQDIQMAFGAPQALLEEMKVTMTTKDITYDSLNDEAFWAVASKALPHIAALHEEYEAVRSGSTKAMTHDS